MFEMVKQSLTVVFHQTDRRTERRDYFQQRMNPHFVLYYNLVLVSGETIIDSVDTLTANRV